MYKLITFEGGSQGLIKDPNSPKLLKMQCSQVQYSKIKFDDIKTLKFDTTCGKCYIEQNPDQIIDFKTLADMYAEFINGENDRSGGVKSLRVDQDDESMKAMLIVGILVRDDGLYIIPDGDTGFVKGFMSFSQKGKDKPIGLISNLYVNPKYRNSGVGSHLLDYANVLASTNNFNSVELTCWSSNKIAFDMYTSRGFKVIEDVTEMK